MVGSNSLRLIAIYHFPNTDNDWIDKTEALLIRSILPPLNEKIPDKVNVQATVPAFDNN